MDIEPQYEDYSNFSILSTKSGESNSKNLINNKAQIALYGSGSSKFIIPPLHG
jgi:hypothetical protein